MSHTIHERGFNPTRFFFHKLGEKAQIVFDRIVPEKISPIHATTLKAEGVRDRHGFQETKLVFTHESGQQTVLLALNLTHSSFVMREAHGTLGKNRSTTEVGPHAALALGPVGGDYVRGYPENTQYLFFTTADGKHYGPPTVQDRFEGIDALLNKPFSGGLVVGRDGSLDIVDQDGIRKAEKEGLAAAQLFNSSADNTAATLAYQHWSFFGRDEQIGSSMYTWSWYYQDQDKTLYICPVKGPKLHNNTLSVGSINLINFHLAQERPWKATLADSGLGGGFVIRSDNGPTFASHPNPELFHTVPLILIARPQ